MSWPIVHMVFIRTVVGHGHGPSIRGVYANLSNIKVENSFIVFQCVFGWYGSGNGLRNPELVHGWFVGIIWFVTFVLQLLPMRWTRWKNNLCRAIPCEFEPVGPIMLPNPLGARWGLLLTLWHVGSSLPTYLSSLFLSSREKIS